MSHKGFDASLFIGGKAAAMLADGFDFALKYLVPGTVNKHKHWTPDEIKEYKNAGFKLGSAWESAGDNIGHFTAAHGTADGQAALQHAKAIGQPAGSAIYFAVDFDASPSEIKNSIIPYFKAAQAALAGKYELAVYGSALVGEQLRGAGLVQKVWIPGSHGWGYGEFDKMVAAQTYTIRQYAPEEIHHGVSVDRDLCLDLTKAGLW
jgi:hypothetical protein